MVENITESTVSPMSAFFMARWSRFQPSHSKNGTVNSRPSTAVYKVTHQATSNRAEAVPTVELKGKKAMFHGRPRSATRPMTAIT
jgi:hypothetical protein